MPADSHAPNEVRVFETISVCYVPPRLKDMLASDADDKGVAISERVIQILAGHFRCPELARPIHPPPKPREEQRRRGRPRGRPQKAAGSR